jgi:hypothetical protein
MFQIVWPGLVCGEGSGEWVNGPHQNTDHQGS